MKLISVEKFVNFFTQMGEKIRDLFHVLWYYSYYICTVDLINKIPFIFDMQTVVGTQIFIPKTSLSKKIPVVVSS